VFIVGRDLVMGRSLVQGDLHIACRIRKLKTALKAQQLAVEPLIIVIIRIKFETTYLPVAKYLKNLQKWVHPPFQG
jgi:hypothetical protein